MLEINSSPRAKPKSKRRARACADAILNSRQNPDAAGVDVGAEELVAAVPLDRTAEPVRTFSSFTAGVHALRDWFLACGIKTVALESTGNYWITTYDVLEEAGLTVHLVNAQFAKNVPGKKTDVCDAQWLQQLHQAGLLRRSFRPSQEVRPLRYLMRHRQEMVREASRQLQRAQKVLTEMNLHLHHVFSDLDGQSAQRIVEAILAGERDPHRLAALRDGRCRTPLARVLESLEGDYRPELLFVLRQTQERRAQIAQDIVACDAEIERLCAAVPNDPPAALSATDGTKAADATAMASEAATSPRPCPEFKGTKSREGIHKNGLGFAILKEAWRFYGVDLSTIDGVGSSTVAVLMSEVGTGAQLRAAFGSPSAFCSWLGLCPDTRKTGGKVIKSKTRRVKSRLALALRMAAQAVGRSRSELGRYAMRMRGRLGKAEGIVATAHKIARIIYGMIVSGKPYDEKVAFAITPAKKARAVHELQRRAQQLGLKLVAAV